MCVWIYLRHYLNLGIIYSLFTEFRTVGPFELDWAAEQYKCWLSQYITTILLSALQALNLFWLFFIVRIAYRFIFNGAASDDREDDEESEAEAEDEQLAGDDADEKTPLVATNGSAATANGHAANGVAKANGAAKR